MYSSTTVVSYLVPGTSLEPPPCLKLRNGHTRYHHFYFPAQLVGEVLPSAIFWTRRGHRCRPFFPPVRAFVFIAHRVQHSHCSSIFIEMLLTHLTLTLTLTLTLNFYARKSPYEYVHSVRIEVTKLIFAGTRITYQATPGTPVEK